MTKQKLTIKEKMSYGFGGFVDQIMSGTFGMKDRRPQKKRGQVINLVINSSSSNLLPCLELPVSNTPEPSTMV